MAIISVRGLSKSFTTEGGELKALSNISFDVIKGEYLLFTGANGSGKTVLMKIIAGLLKADEGAVVFEKPFSRESVGLVFQDADSQLIGETLEEDVSIGPRNLKLPRVEIEQRVSGALSIFGLSAKKERSPRTLSGGEKRRLAIAGIAAMKKEIIIFDEPFANLDYNGTRETLRLISALKAERKTVIVLTHELEKTLALADRLAVLAKGKLAVIDTPEKALSALDESWNIRDPRVNYSKIENCVWL